MKAEDLQVLVDQMLPALHEVCIGLVEQMGHDKATANLVFFSLGGEIVCRGLSCLPLAEGLEGLDKLSTAARAHILNKHKPQGTA